jgi:Ca2+-transporting ATPase
VLTSEEARRRLLADGPNTLPSEARRGLLGQIVEVLREPMLLLLVGAAGLYGLLGETLEAGVLAGWVGAMITLNVVQQRRTESALAALRDLTAPHCFVIRDGERRRVPAAEVVRGDTVVVAEGDRVPADARLVEGTNVACDEALLTGESVPVRKVPGPEGAAPAEPGGDDQPWLWSGTLAVSGRGLAVVHATGPGSAIGRIGQSLAGLQQEPTRLEAETRRAVRWLGTFAIGCCAALVLGLGLARGDWLQAALAGIALAMSMIPEEFPVILTVFHALGARRLAQRGVLVRRSAAVEALGSTTVLCTDKTGTLTSNRMEVARLVGDGDEHRVVEGDLPERVHAVLEYAVLASPVDPFDPMEQAFRRLAEGRLAGTEHLHERWESVRDYPLSPTLLAVAHVWRARAGQPYVVAAKGAVEAIVDLCHLPPEAAAPIVARAEAWSAAGLRVLGVARSESAEAPLPDHPHQFPFTFVGLVGLLDPVRPAVPAAIASCRAAGVRVVMITGDSPATARAIARDAGLGDDVVVDHGAALAALDDDALRARMREVGVVARAVPTHKLRIVRALQADGHVVAMTGDGVNDAPALRAADIGVAMGGRGTDVARESAAIVITDDDFASIVAGVAEGRRIHDNLRRAFAFVLAVHVPAVGLALLPLVLGWPLILLPFHVAFLELVIDPACSVAFEGQPPAPDLMSQPPRAPGAPLFSTRRVVTSVAHGALVFATAAAAFAWALPSDPEVARGLAFGALIAGSAGLIAGHRGTGRNPIASGLSAGATALVGLVLAVPPLGTLFRIAPPPAWAGLGAVAAGWLVARASSGLLPTDPVRVRARRAQLAGR